MNKSRKNISSVLHDVKHPQAGPRATKPTTNKARPKLKKPTGNTMPGARVAAKPALVGLVIGLVIGLGGYGLYSTGVASSVIESVRGWNLNNDDGELSELAISTEDIFKLPSFFGDIGDVIGAIRGISSGVSELNSRGLALILSGDGGDEFVGILKRLHENLATLNRIGFDVDEKIPSFVTGDNNEMLQFSADAKSLEEGLGAIISFLDVPEDKHIVLLFENQSEIRPSGGFIGSYGDVVLDKGSVKSIEVDDIYTPDRNVEYRIIPPKQLQSITVNWGARDANWFFDFPTSAEKVLNLLESSEMYANDDIRFDGAVALNGAVVSDILEIIGPIDVPEYGVTLTSENFLLAVREEVEEARDEEPKENPKQILGLIAPTIIERAQALDEDAKADLVVALLGRAFNKDLKIYFRDPDLQGFVEDTPFSGSVYELPDVFNGDYLAVVNANVAGGKTDLFIRQSVELDSKITLAGNVDNDLTIRREHFGQDQEQELYTKTNQNFIKIFTPLGTLLNSEFGSDRKTVNPRIDYEDAGYSVDPVLEDLESTFVDINGSGLDRYLESGKNVFAGWFSTPPGETRTLKLNYSRGDLFIAQGAKYQFIFDKQSGVETTLNYTVTAPSGYMWRESSSQEYSYIADSIPGRLVLNLTLVEQE